MREGDDITEKVPVFAPHIGAIHDFRRITSPSGSGSGSCSYTFPNKMGPAFDTDVFVATFPPGGKAIGTVAHV